jgi:hypothetical protein
MAWLDSTKPLKSTIYETNGIFADHRGVIATAMRIAGQIVQRAEFPKNGDIGCGAERLFQFGKIGDLVST